MVRSCQASLFLSLFLLTIIVPAEARAQTRSESTGDPGRAPVEASVASVSPGEVKIAPGSSAAATISGGGLDLPGLALEIRKKDGRSVQGKVTAGLGRSSGATSRKLTVRAKEDAAPGKYIITLKGPETNVALPLTVNVTAPAAGARRLETSAPAGKEGAVPAPGSPGGDPSSPGAPSHRAAGEGTAPAAGLQPPLKKIEIVGKGGKKKTLPKESGKVPGTGGFGAALTTQQADLRCTVRAFYDEAGMSPVDLVSSQLGTWHYADAKPQHLMWTHVEVIYEGAEPEPVRVAPKRAVDPFKVDVRFRYKSYTGGFSSTWKEKEFSYEPPIGPSESYVYTFWTKGWMMVDKGPLYISARVDPADVVAEPEENNTCNLKVYFANP